MTLDRKHPVRLGLVAALALVGTAARADDKADVIAAENAFARAIALGDAAAVDRLMTPDYAGSGSSGAVHDKAYWMRLLRAGKVKASQTRTRTLTARELHVTVSGADAVVLGDDRKTTWLDLWVRRPGGWRILASHRAFRQ